MVERIARPVEGGVVWQQHQRLVLRQRHGAAVVAVDHRDRAAPVTLARDQPVAQAEVDLAGALRSTVDDVFSSRVATVSKAVSTSRPSRKSELKIEPSST